MLKSDRDFCARNAPALRVVYSLHFSFFHGFFHTPSSNKKRCVSIYRLRCGRNRLCCAVEISFGIREPYDITQIETYELPSDDDMIMQAVDQMICEVCMFNEHCYMGMCIANKEWREEMRKTLFNAAKGKT